MKTLFYQYNPWWEVGYTPPLFISRPSLEAALFQLIDNRSVVLLTGLRRAGKTTLLKVLANHLIKEMHIKKEAIFYVSMDDYQLQTQSIIDIVETYRQLHRFSQDEQVYLLLDEITYKENFRLQLKNLYDKGNCKIFASSSSASALRDKKGLLTGRERIIEVHPLDFSEYLAFSNITVKKADEHLLAGYFEDYMQIGGMPEYVLTRDRGYLTELVNDILYKDIVAVHGIKSAELIKDYFALLMERVGKQISLNKVANILGISPDSAKRYLGMFVDCYLVYVIPRYGKTNEMLLSPKKVYAADVGIKNLITGFRDKGAVFENLVFQKIKSESPRYVYQDGIELDFITEGGILIESKYGQVLTDKQQTLFDSFKARDKKVIRGYQDFL
jgi:predicted AAA+ superfamily ATPase